MSESEVQILPGVSAWEALSTEWEALRVAAGQPAFQGPAYTLAYFRAREPWAQPLLVLLRRQGRLAAVAPLLRDARSIAGVEVRRLRSAGDAVLFRYDLAGPAEAAGALWDGLARYPGWDMLELRNAGADAHIAAWRERAAAAGWLAGGLELMRSPWLDASAPPTASGHFLKNLRRVRRQLAAQGPLRLEYLPRATGEDMSALSEMEASGWKGRQGTALAVTPMEGAHLRAAAAAFEVYRLRLAQQTVAMAIGMSAHGRFHVGKWSYDEAYARFSPGHLLIEAMIADCAARGRREFHFEGNADPYKLQWTKATVTHSRLYIYRRGWKGRVLQAIRDLR